MQRLRGRWQFAWIIAAWAVSRAALVAAAILAARNFLGDVYLYATWAALLVTGHYPVGDPYWQYPPGAGLLFALSAVTPPDPVHGFVALAVIADTAILALLLYGTRQQHLAPNTWWWGPWMWIIGGIAVGPIMVARFDLFPTVFAVAAIVFVARPWLSGIASGLGGLLKVWPVLLLAIIPRRRLLIAAVTAALTMGIGLAVFAHWAPGSTSFMGEQKDRGLQAESTAALPYLLGGLIGIDPRIVLRFGSFEVTAPGAATIGLVVTLLGLAAMAGIGLLRLLGRLEHVAPGDVGLALVLVSVATSRVFSPQYTIWLVGVAVAAGLDPTSRTRRVTLLLIAMAAVTQVVFPWLYGSLLHNGWWAIAPHALRMVMLWTATASSLAVVVAPGRCDHWPIIRRLVPPR